MGSRFSTGIFLFVSLWIVFPCIGYAQEKDTIPSISIEEEELINTTCFPFAGASHILASKYSATLARAYKELI